VHIYFIIVLHLAGLWCRPRRMENSGRPISTVPLIPGVPYCELASRSLSDGWHTVNRLDPLLSLDKVVTLAAGFAGGGIFALLLTPFPILFTSLSSGKLTSSLCLFLSVLSWTPQILGGPCLHCLLAPFSILFPSLSSDKLTLSISFSVVS
jgi:hypothetical protein